MSAPLPWKAQAANKYYLQILDASGVPVCDFFPFAVYGRGWDATMAIAQQIVEMMNGIVSATAGGGDG